MKSNLVKDTTKEERIALIRSWVPVDESMEDCEMDLWDIYADYINGTKEIAEINAQMTGTFYTEEDLQQKLSEQQSQVSNEAKLETKPDEL